VFLVYPGLLSAQTFEDSVEGDHAALMALYDRYNRLAFGLAYRIVGNPSLAEEVVQETWLGVIRGIERFEGRSSLRTWIFRITANIAKTRAERAAWTVPFPAVPVTAEATDAAVAPERFLAASHDRFAGHWAAPPARWDTNPEERLRSKETLARIRDAIETLPPAQRAVITLRDIEQWSSDEVCELLDVSEANQRVLLHRARSRVRAALEQHLD
jgi:RNA polymerase sigma-70 factor (ECF subfamily)